METLLPMLEGMAARLLHATVHRPSYFLERTVEKGPMLPLAIHRIVEQQAAARGDALAVVDGARALSYRELNQRANGVARRLMSEGFRRADRALVRMDPGSDLAVVLLGVLKAGGCYSLAQGRGAGAEWPHGVSLARSPGDDGAFEYQVIDVSSVLHGPAQPSPNLPVLTRASDTACVLQDGDGSPLVLVPHATVAALRHRAVPQPACWTGDQAALDLWFVLMAGGTLSNQLPPQAAAA